MKAKSLLKSRRNTTAGIELGGSEDLRDRRRGNAETRGMIGYFVLTVKL